MVKIYYCLVLAFSTLGLFTATPVIASSTVTATINPVNGTMTYSKAISYSYSFVEGSFVEIAAGTTTYSATLKVNGVTRQYLVLRPNPAPANAPVLLLLHPLGTSAAQMANLTEVAGAVATQGFWAVMPSAKNGQWDDNPIFNTDDDVQFISTLIDTLVSQGADASRVYAAGYSDGGFMTERLACELSNKIAAFAIDAAEMINPPASYCKPAVQRSKLYILGTADPLVGYYNGSGLFAPALSTMSFWAGQQGCGGTMAETLPTVVNDGTSVQLTSYTGCAAGTGLRLYTVENGGHAWPGGLTNVVGKTSQNLDATGVIWAFASGYSL